MPGDRIGLHDFRIHGAGLPYPRRRQRWAPGPVVQATLIGAIPVGQFISRLLATLAERNRAEEDLLLKVISCRSRRPLPTSGVGVLTLSPCVLSGRTKPTRSLVFPRKYSRPRSNR